MTIYPNGIDSILQLPTVPGSTPEDIAINALQGAAIAIETELGINPKSIYSDVATRLTILESRISSGVVVGPGVIDINTQTAGVLQISRGGTGLNAAGAVNTVLVSGGSSVFYQLITNSNIDPAAAIAGTKIDPNFGAQKITISGISAPSPGAGTGVIYYDTGTNKLRASENGGSFFDLAGTTFIAGGDLTGSTTNQQVISLTGSAGVINIVSTGATIQWAANTLAPKLLQADDASSSITGQALTVQAQNATGTTSNGGDLILTSGTGTSVNGNLKLQNGGTDLVTLITTNLSLFNSTGSFGSGSNVTFINDAITPPSSNPTGGTILYSESGVLKVRQPDGAIKPVDSLFKYSEVLFTSGEFSTGSNTFVRVGSRSVDMSRFPATFGSLTRAVTFVADIDMTSGATSVEVKLVDITNFVDVTNTDLTSSSLSNTEVTSAILTVGSSAGDIRDDFITMYEVDIQMNGGTITDQVFITNARLEITYS